MTLLSSLKPSGGSQGAKDGVLNVLDFGLVNDGVTDNLNAWNAFKRGLKSYGRGLICTPVTITPGSPGIFNYTAHGMQEGDCIIFSTTGTLPSPLVAGQPYYVLSKYVGTVLNADQFQISSTNAALVFDGISEAPVNIASAGTGTHSFQKSGVEKISVVFPPGYYKGSYGFQCGLKNLDFTFNGAFVDEIGTGDYSFVPPYGGGNTASGQQIQEAAYIQTVLARANVINLKDASRASAFVVGGWIGICGIDTQSTLGGFGDGTPSSDPANNHAFEFARVIAKSGSSLTIDRLLRQTYLSTWPIFYSGTSPTLPGQDRGCGGGAACIIPMNPAWDSHRVFRGAHSIAGGQQPTNVRESTLIDFRFESRGTYPSGGEKATFIRCYWSINSDIEVDKFSDFVSYIDCDIQCGMSMQSTTTHHMLFRGTYLASLNGTDKNVTFEHCKLNTLLIGTCGSGVTDSLRIIHSQVGHIEMSNYFWSPMSSNYLAKFGEGWTGAYAFNNGVLSQPLHTTSANSFAVPGANMYFADYANRYDNMGQPFKIKDIYMSPPESAAVSVSVGPTSPSTPVDAVVTWTAGGIPNNGDILVFTGPKVGWPFPPAYAVNPWMFMPYMPFKVSGKGVAPLASNQFKLVCYLGSDQVNPVKIVGTTATVQAVINPQFNIVTTLKSLPTGDSTNPTVTISIANPAVINVGAPHGLVADDVVIFTTTGALPGGVIGGDGVPQGITLAYPYFVMAAGLTTNTFQVSDKPASQGRPAISTLGYSQSGTHTAHSNPIQIARHPCARFTAYGNFGSGINDTWFTSITAQEGAYDEPIFSRCRGTLGGKQGQDLYSMPAYYAWGNVEEITINVIQPWAGTGTCLLNLKFTVFDTALHKFTENQVIDLTQVGIRKITRSTVTGAATNLGGNSPGDTIAIMTKWMCGRIYPTFSYSVGGNSYANQPLVDIKIKGDQGITATSNFASYDDSTDNHGQFTSVTSIITKPP